MKPVLAAVITAVLIRAAGWAVTKRAGMTETERPLDDMLAEAWKYRRQAWLMGDVPAIFTWRDAFDRLLDRLIDERGLPDNYHEHVGEECSSG